MRIMIRDAFDLANLRAAQASAQGEEGKQDEQREPRYCGVYMTSPVFQLAAERGSC